jgi:hypothetical protein
MHDTTPRIETPTLATGAPRQAAAQGLPTAAPAALPTPPGDPRWAAAGLWRTLSLMWLSLGLLALAAAAFWSPAAQAGRDALGLGFLGSAAGALGCGLYGRINPDRRRMQEALLLAAAFWSAGVTAVVLAQAVVGQPWIWTGLAPTLSGAVGCGLLLSLQAVRRQGSTQRPAGSTAQGRQL